MIAFVTYTFCPNCMITPDPVTTESSHFEFIAISYDKMCSYVATYLCI